MCLAQSLEHVFHIAASIKIKLTKKCRLKKKISCISSLTFTKGAHFSTYKPRSNPPRAAKTKQKKLQRKFKYPLIQIYKTEILVHENKRLYIHRSCKSEEGRNLENGNKMD